MRRQALLRMSRYPIDQADGRMRRYQDGEDVGDVIEYPWHDQQLRVKNHYYQRLTRYQGLKNDNNNQNNHVLTK